MKTDLKARAPQTRCYHCGSAEIASVCHHCGKAMCRSRRPGLTHEGKPVSKEFDGLVDDTGIYHCPGCDHTVKGRLRWLIAVGAATGVTGLLITFLAPAAGLPLLLAGAAVGAGGYYLDRKRLDAAFAARPPLPLVPNIDTVTVVETLHGRLTLDRHGRYRSTAEPVTGLASGKMTIAESDRDRLADYRKKYRLSAGDPVELCAGFAALRGPAGLEFTGDFPGGASLLGGGRIAFRGGVPDHPLFAGQDGKPPGEWEFRAPYRLHSEREAGQIPLWLVPSLMPVSDQRTFELDLQWVDFGPERERLQLERIELIELHVPTLWGNVESADPGDALISSPSGPDAGGEPPAGSGDSDEQPARIIEWRRLPAKPRGSGEDGRRQAHSRTLTIRFEDKIELTDTVSGRIKMVFAGSLSGVRGLSFYHPLGGRRDQVKCQLRTEVTADFELSLHGIRYQDVKVVPGSGDSLESDELPGVIPDYHTVIDVTNLLSGQEYYVKRVIENPPRAGSRAGLMNRFWDIAGRWYDGVYPIDFHITLTGEEEYQGNVRAQAGNTSVNITVQGDYANEDMERRIQNQWVALRTAVLDRLRARAMAPIGPPAPGPAEDGLAGTGPDVSGPDSAGPDLRGPAGLGPAGLGPAGLGAAGLGPAATGPFLAGAGWPGGGDPARESVLRGRLETATGMLINGQISEETYREIKARTEAELAELLRLNGRAGS